MTTYPYLIIGGGMTADAAVRGIRSIDKLSPIAILGEEQHPPYKRPPLSKALWSGKDEDSVWLKTKDHTVDLLLGRRAVSIDPVAHTVKDDQGSTVGYRKLLLATGSRARPLPGLPTAERVLPFRTLDDFRAVRSQVKPGTRVAVVGGGFIGAELSAGLHSVGAEVHMIFPEPAIGGGRFPADLALALTADYRSRGVHLHSESRIASARTEDDGILLTLDDAQVLRVELVVVGIGTIPNTEVAADLGVEVDGGIHVDETLRTSHPDIFAAGDVASFPHAALGKRLRIEHEDAALSMGQHAGRGMAGKLEPYLHVPFFYSDLFDNGYEAVGELDGRLQMISTWTDPLKQGIVYYHDGERVRGVLLFNEWGQLERAQELLQQGTAVDLTTLATTPAPAHADA